jgi:hypothetical protein
MRLRLHADRRLFSLLQACLDIHISCGTGFLPVPTSRIRARQNCWCVWALRTMAIIPALTTGGSLGQALMIMIRSSSGEPGAETRGPASPVMPAPACAGAVVVPAPCCAGCSAEHADSGGSWNASETCSSMLVMSGGDGNVFCAESGGSSGIRPGSIRVWRMASAASLPSSHFPPSQILLQ